MKTQKTTAQQAEDRAYTALRAKGKSLWPSRKGKNLPDRHVQGSYGDYSYCALDTPEGMTGEDYYHALNAARTYSYPAFRLEGETVIEENYCSIGD